MVSSHRSLKKVGHSGLGYGSVVNSSGALQLSTQEVYNPYLNSEQPIFFKDVYI